MIHASDILTLELLKLRNKKQEIVDMATIDFQNQKHYPTTIFDDRIAELEWALNLLFSAKHA